MEIIQMRPKDAVVNSLIESYFFISNMQPRQVTTIPNGRVDATIILEGEVKWLYSKGSGYKSLPTFCFYPLTNKVNEALVKGTLKCISIKFYPHLLALSPFQGKTFDKPMPFSNFFKSPRLNSKLLKDLTKAEGHDEWIELLDKYFVSILFPNETNSWLQKVTAIIEDASGERIKIQQVANAMGVSIKTLERKFITITGLTPKEYFKIVQLQRTIRNSKKDIFLQGDLTKLFGVEYYDQAHFVKSCRNISGLTPKQLFVKLAKGLTDVVLQ